jgi:hypothetical protein
VNYRVLPCYSVSYNLAISDISANEFKTRMRPNTEQGLAAICEIVEDTHLVAS